MHVTVIVTAISISLPQISTGNLNFKRVLYSDRPLVLHTAFKIILILMKFYSSSHSWNLCQRKRSKGF